MYMHDLEKNRHILSALFIADKIFLKSAICFETYDFQKILFEEEYSIYEACFPRHINISDWSQSTRYLHQAYKIL